MTAYYNEIDPYAADWLRNLIKEGLIADGEVDTRSIVDVRPGDLAGYTQCHFFAGLGGWSGALRLAGISDAEPLWTGSCPCQPFSRAGKQKGFEDERHLWPVWQELIRVRRPATILGEQVASASDWLAVVRGDLEEMGYAVGAIPCEAASAGADHLRDRYWFVANVTSDDEQRPREPQESSEPQISTGGLCSTGELAYPDDTGPQGRRLLSECADQQPSRPDGLDWVLGADGKARRVKPGIRLLAHGVPARVAKLRALGNAIDLRPAAAFIAAALNLPFCNWCGSGEPCAGSECGYQNPRRSGAALSPIPQFPGAAE